MVDQQQTSETFTPFPRNWLACLLVVLFFGAAAFLRTDLLWEIAGALAISLVAIGFSASQDPAALSADLANRPSAVRSSLDGKSIYLPVINAFQFPVFLLDGKANVRYYNEQAASAFGELRVGERISLRFRQPEFRNRVQEVLGSGHPVSFEYNEPVPNDRWYTVDCSRLDTRDASVPLAEQLYLLAFHDQSEMRKIDQMRSDFIANASHELRTPLASLLGYIETLRGPAKDDHEAQERFTGVMLEQAERMSRLVNDLLSLSRIEMKAHLKPSDIVSLRDVLSSVVSSLEALAMQVDVQIELELEEDFQIVGDRDELIQVFENLVQNACKYGEEGEKVIVSARRTKTGNHEQAVVSVKDFGPGIPLEHQHRITERFYRIDVARSREKQGTGLGLAIVKHILHRHGTRLQVKSKPGEGAEFAVLFDLSD